MSADMTTGPLDDVRLAEVLARTDTMTELDVALALAELGCPVVPTVPGDKDPMLAKRHIDGIDATTGERVAPPCESCQKAKLQPARDHGETLDPDVIRRYWTVHPDAGVGLKNHPRLARGDGDFDDVKALRRARKAIGYGQPGGCPEPCEASTPGGMYRRRWIHTLPEGVPAPGGGTKLLGVSWYGASGYTLVKGGHPKGVDYPPFHGTITPLPDTVAFVLHQRGEGTPGAPAASTAEVAAFLDAHTGTGQLAALDRRRRIVADAEKGDRHYTALGQLACAFREALADWYPARLAHDAIREALGEAGWEASRFDGEWAEVTAWALGAVKHLDKAAAIAAIAERAGSEKVKQLEAGYPSEYIDHLIAESWSWDPTIDELDALMAASTNGHSADRSTTITFRPLPDPFEVAPLEWLAKGLLVKLTHGELAGPEKALKSYIGQAIDVGLAAGSDILGRWPVPHRQRTLILIGEGGEAVFLRRIARLCDGYGITVDDIRPMMLHTVETASVSSPRFIDGVSEALDAFQPDIVHIDPWYSYAPGEVDARNLYEQGAALERVGHLVRSGGATLLINNHFNQTGSGNGLRRISMAGHAEWCDSWLLVDHREQPDVAAGRFRLKLDAGSRQWGGGAFHIDFDIGRFNTDTNEHDGRIEWHVTNANTASVDNGEQADKIAAAREALVKGWRTRRGGGKSTPITQGDWFARARGHRNTDLRAAFRDLIDDGRIVERSFEIVDKSGRSQTRWRYELVESSFEKGDT